MSDYLKPRELGDGLVLRWAMEDDVERIAALTSQVFRETAEEPPNPENAAWLRDLGSGRHPLTNVDRCVFVEDTRTGQVVACTWLISAVWTYGGMRFSVARPEHVASHPDYRRRGLMRALFEAFHARSAAEGDLVQAITGIPYFYRQFGYEYALDLGGSRRVAFSSIPRLKEGETEPYTLRLATAADVPLLRRLYDRERASALVSVRIEDDYWHYCLDRLAPPWHAHLILNGSGQPAGYVLSGARRWGPAIPVFAMAVEAGTSLVAVLPPVLRALEAHSATLPPPRKPDAPPLSSIQFVLGRSHPVYDALDTSLAAGHEPPYAWYVRVPDLPGFIRHIAPVLEARLAGSVAAGHSGELCLDFYRGGLRLVFADGRLVTAEEWRAPIWEAKAKGGFPPLVFLQLLFGHRSLDELRHAFPDVWAEDEGRPLLEALFPPQRSWAMPLG